MVMNKAKAVSATEALSPQIPLQPVFLPVKNRIQESADVVTLEFSLQNLVSRSNDQPVKEGLHSLFEPLTRSISPGQFNMLYAFGVGEVPISVSGYNVETGQLLHTVRGVGAVSNALLNVQAGQQLGLRGPYGRGWPMNSAYGKDVLLIAGGIGMAPLRPVMRDLIRHRSHYGNIVLLYGARHPLDLLFMDELQQWQQQSDLQVHISVDSASAEWRGNVGVVTQLLNNVRFDAPESIAMICGPDMMIKFTSLALEDRGISAQRIHVSMERSMKCAVGSCGHCQFGPYFVCSDGPVFPLADIHQLSVVKEI